MATQHKNIVDADRHEPKGATAAAANTVYISNGAGSGSWLPVVAGNSAEMFINNGATATTIPAAADATLSTDTDYRKLTAGWALYSQTGVISFATDKLIVSRNGDYTVYFNASIVGGNASVTGIKIVKNDITPYSTRKQSFTHSSATAKMAVGIKFIMTGLIAGDSLSIYLANTVGNVTVEQASMSCELSKAN